MPKQTHITIAKLLRGRLHNGPYSWDFTTPAGHLVISLWRDRYRPSDNHWYALHASRRGAKYDRRRINLEQIEAGNCGYALLCEPVKFEPITSSNPRQVKHCDQVMHRIVSVRREPTMWLVELGRSVSVEEYLRTTPTQLRLFDDALGGTPGEALYD
jgi:hypothetical protein